MLTHKFVDYLQYSIDKRFAPVHGDAQIINGITNYTHGLKMPDETRVYFGHHKTDKPLVIMSGIAMHNIRRLIPEQEYIETVLTNGGKISRLDMTMDIYVSDGFIRTEDFMSWYWENKIVSSHVLNGEDKREPSVIAKLSDEGIRFETVSFGDIPNRAKKGMVRVYDKGIELNLEEFMITRVEVEDKRDKAHVSAKRVVKHDVASTLKTRFDVLDDLYQQAIDAPSIDISRGQAILSDNSEKRNSRWAWLIETVAPTLGKAIAEDEKIGIDANKQLFEQAMFKAYNEGIVN